MDKSISKKTAAIILISCLFVVGVGCGVYFIVKENLNPEPEPQTNEYSKMITEYDQAISESNSDKEKADLYLNFAYNLKEYMEETGTNTCEKITEYTEQVKKLTDDESMLRINESISATCSHAVKEFIFNISTGVNAE